MSDLNKKLKIKEGTKIVLLNSPRGFQKQLSPLPKGAKVIESGRSNEFVMLFVENKLELEREIIKACKTLKKDGLIWICYPKGSSGKQTDLTRDKGWECLDKIDMNWLSLISLDDTWSAFCMRNEPRQARTSKASNDYHDHVAEWIDAVNKKVKVPSFLDKEMKAGKVNDVFNSLNFTNRKEYVMWIVSAKQEKTRGERVKNAIIKLKAGKKNPSEK
jgi:hypothetical protein